jgi:hypothetical protein
LAELPAEEYLQPPFALEPKGVWQKIFESVAAPSDPGAGAKFNAHFERMWGAAEPSGTTRGQQPEDRSARWKDRRCPATIGLQDFSTSTGDLLCPLHVDTGGQLRANTGRRRLGERVKSTRSGRPTWCRNQADRAKTPRNNKTCPNFAAYGRGATIRIAPSTFRAVCKILARRRSIPGKSG